MGKTTLEKSIKFNIKRYKEEVKRLRRVHGMGISEMFARFDMDKNYRYSYLSYGYVGDSIMKKLVNMGMDRAYIVRFGEGEEEEQDAKVAEKIKKLKSGN